MTGLLAPKRRAWFAAALIAGAASIAVYAVWDRWIPWRPGRSGGLTFGTLAGLWFLFDGCYPLRRRLRAWPLGTAQRWLQAHIYGGSLALLFVAIHTGFTWPHGAMGWWLIGLSTWTVASGLFGVFLQKWIPQVIAGTLKLEALRVRIPEITARLLDEADRVMHGASDRLWAAYRADIRPALEHPEPAWSYVANVQGGRLRYSASLEVLERAVSEQDRIDELRAIVREKAELDVHLSLQRALRAWLVLHVPPAIVLLGLLAVHVFAVLYL